MLEFFYKERRALVDFRRGPLGPHFDGFAVELKGKGYYQDYARNILSTCCLFNAFLIEEGIKSYQRISPDLTESFLDVYLKGIRSITGYQPRLTAKRQITHFHTYLVKNDVVKPFVPKPVVTCYSWLLEPHLKYLQTECQLTEWVIKTRRNQLDAFLKGLGDKVSRKRIRSLDPLSIEAYIKQEDILFLVES